MLFRKIIAATAVGLSLASAAGAQSLTAETMKATGQEKRNIRVAASGKKDLDVFGFTDFSKNDKGGDQAYGELHLRRGAFQSELNAGTGMKPVWRAGYVHDILKDGKDRFYLSGKFLPLALSAGRLQREVQFGVFGYAKAPKGFYIENWTDYTLAEGKKPSLLAEFTGGKDIAKGLSLQAQAAYNVNSPGWALRAGGRYKLF